MKKNFKLLLFFIFLLFFLTYFAYNYYINYYREYYKVNRILIIPTSLSIANGIVVQLCEIDYNKYYNNPSKYSNFRLLTKDKKNCFYKPIYDLMRSNFNYPIPNGFIFHQSRCGSTSVSNILAKDSNNLVFSEPNFFVVLANHCILKQKMYYFTISFLFKSINLCITS